MNNYVNKSESQLHINLVKEMVEWFKDTKGYTIKAADLEEYDKPEVVENTNKIGDREDKMPDVDAFDNVQKVYVRGEAKVGNGDLESLHTKTQIMLFSDRHNKENGKASLLYVIVPKAQRGNLDKLLLELGLKGRANVIAVSSGRY